MAGVERLRAARRRGRLRAGPRGGAPRAPRARAAPRGARLRRGAVHARVVSGRRAADARLRAYEGADARAARRVGRAHDAPVRHRRRVPARQRRPPAPTRCSCSTAGSARSARPTTSATCSRTRGASSPSCGPRRAAGAFRDGHARTCSTSMKTDGGSGHRPRLARAARRRVGARGPRPRRAGEPRSRRCCSRRCGVVEAAVRDVLRRAGGRPGHVFNLGHGLMPADPARRDRAGGGDRAVHRQSADAPRPPRTHRLTGRCTTRPTDRRTRPTKTGVLLLAYGTPETPGARRPVLHAHPRRPPAVAGGDRRPACTATRPSAAARRSPRSPRRCAPAWPNGSRRAGTTCRCTSA